MIWENGLIGGCISDPLFSILVRFLRLLVAVTIMLSPKSFAINDVDLSGRMLTFVLTFKSLPINDVDLVDGIMHLTKDVGFGTFEA